MATLAVTAAGLLIAAGGWWQARGTADRAALTGELMGAVLIVLPYGLAGAVLLDRRPDLPFGWLLAAGCALHTVYIAATVIAYQAVASGRLGTSTSLVALGTAFGFVYLPIQGLINLRFPSGRLSSRKARVLQWVIVGGTLASLAAIWLSAPVDRGETGTLLSAIRNPFVAAGSPVSRVAGQLFVLIPLTILAGVLAGLGVVIRYLRATGLERRQLKWRATHVVFALALFPLAVTGHLPFDRADNILFVLTLAIPVLRYRLWAIDTIISRSVAYAAVTAALTALYALVAAVGARLASRPLGTTVAVMAVVLAFGPLRRQVGGTVDRLFYGQRNDPYATLSHLGQRLRDVTTPGQVLPAAVQAVTSALRLPYAALERAADGAVLASAGEAGTVVDRWPLTFEGRHEGWLVASPRRGEDRFDERDRQLLDDVARQIASAVHADALTDDLLRSRQQLVTAREEERRRLRRDLHDGLGPVLTGVILKVDAARTRLTSAPDEAGQLLTEAKEASSQAIKDLRQVVYGLRPPALDDLGLVGAVRAQTERLAAGTRLTVTVEADDDLPTLPAAVEVAAYRTAVEAVANSIRHSGATRCAVALRASTGPRFLEATVTDNGPGTGGPWVPGVGLAAMRERAEEVGGTLTAGPGPAGGTVSARFPLLEPAPPAPGGQEASAP